jgi:hypothetical protein
MHIFNSIMIAVLIYFFLMLFEEVLGTTRTIRIIIAAGVGFFVYKYGHSVIPWISHWISHLNRFNF